MQASMSHVVSKEGHIHTPINQGGLFALKTKSYQPDGQGIRTKYKIEATS